MRTRLTRLLTGAALAALVGVVGLGTQVGLRAVGPVTVSSPTTFTAINVGDDSPGDPTTYTVNGDLTIATGGSITCYDTGATGASACPIKIVVTGNLLMEAGSAITAENTNDGGHGGNITITVGGNMTLCGPAGAQAGCRGPSAQPGAVISSQKTSGAGDTGVGGDITITVGNAATVTGAFYMEGGTTGYGTETGAKIDATGPGASGDITITPGGSYVTEPGSVVQSGGHDGSAIQQGGKIYIVAGCELRTEGRITSKGTDPGADLVHLEGCEVTVRGLAESTGKGHTVDADPAAVNKAPFNSCDGYADNDIPGANPPFPGYVQNEVVHSDKPARATGCIEVWGKVITIDSGKKDPNNPQSANWAGELNVDIGDGGTRGTGWIDIFAYATMTVIDGPGNDRLSNNLGHEYFSTYAVHANSVDGSDGTPGMVTARVKHGPLTATGKAFESSATMNNITGHNDGNINHYFVGNGSDGGTIDLEASGAVTLDDAWVNAAGDFVGTPPLGGHILVQAWGAGSGIAWREVDGDVQPNTTGTITLGACSAIDTTGTEFHGETLITSSGGANCDPTKPDIPAYAGRFPGYVYDVFNVEAWTKCEASTVSGIKFKDLDGDGFQDPTEPLLDGWVIHLFNGSYHATAVTVGGTYTFTGVPVGTYTVCEALPATTPPWQQTAPTSGANCLTAVDPNADNATPGALGYTVDLTNGECCRGQHVTGKDFGNIQLATKSGLKWLDAIGNGVRDLPDDIALDGWVIHLFGTAVNGSPVHKTFTTAGGGLYAFTVLPGTYTVCEQLQAPSIQTFPTAGANCVALVDADNPTPGPVGYAITLAGGDTDTGNDFGNDPNNNRPPPPTCPEDANRAALLTRTVNLSKPNLDGGGVAGDPKNYWTVQAAYNAAKASGQAEVIGLFANTTENLTLDGSKSLTITQCTVARVTAANSSYPVWNITSTGKLTIIGPDSVGGTIGWQVGGNGGHTLKSIRANGASVDGVLITSNSNSVSWNDVSGNGNGSATAAGIRVQGSSNTLKGGTVASNKGDGVQLTGNSNELSGSTIQSNTGNGVLVSGSTNTVKSNSRINLNTKNGICVSGSNNTVSSNASESGKGNTLNGILVSAGSGNQLTDNKMSSNGQAGFSIAAGTGTKLKSNANANNTGSEFTIGSGNVDQGSNKKNGSSFTFTNTGGNFN
jgi:parallel beta-helix repeat protein